MYIISNLHTHTHTHTHIYIIYILGNGNILIKVKIRIMFSHNFVLKDKASRHITINYYTFCLLMKNRLICYTDWLRESLFMSAAMPNNKGRYIMVYSLPCDNWETLLRTNTPTRQELRQVIIPVCFSVLKELIDINEKLKRRSRRNQRPEFKSRTKLFAFHYALFPLGNTWIHLFFPRVLLPWLGNKYWRRKIQTSFTPLKN